MSIIFYSTLDGENDTLGYLLENFIVYISICLLFVFATNVFKYLKNFKKKDIRYFDFDDNNSLVTIGLCKNYSTKIFEIKTSYQNLSYRFKTSTATSTLSDKIEIEFYDNSIFIGTLNPKNIIWNKSQRLAKQLINELYRINAKKLTPKNCAQL